MGKGEGNPAEVSTGVVHGRRKDGYAIRYSSGNFAKSLYESTFSLVYLYFLVDVLKLDPASAGTALLLSIIFDAAINPLLGRGIDRWLQKAWTYQRIIRVAAPFTAVFFILLFAVPAMASPPLLPVVIIATALFRAGCTLVDLPHNALLADLTLDSRDRVKLSSWRFFFSSLGNIAVLFGLAPALSRSGASRPLDFIILAVITGFIYVGIMIHCVGGSVAGRSKQPAPASVQTTAAIMDLARNGRLLRVLAVCVLSAGLATVFMRMTVFYAKTSFGDAAVSIYLLGAQMCGQIAGLPLWQRIASRSEKTSAAIASQLLLALSMVAFFVAAPRSLPIALPLFFLTGLGMGGLTVMNWAIVPDTIEYTEAACGRRHEALTFGAFLFLNKLGSGFALASVGWLLAALHYNGAPSVSVLALAGAMAGVPLIGAVASAVILGGLKMTHVEHDALSRKPTP